MLRLSILRFMFISFLLQGGILAAQQVPVDEETGKIVYREVVQQEGSREQLFNRAISWLNEYYVNPVSVTKTRDPKSGLIKGLHRFRIRQTLEDGTRTDAGTLQYEFKIELKENRYRYTLSDFVLRQSSAIPAEKWLKEDNPLAKDYLAQLHEFATGWIESLKEGMKPPATSADDDDW
ncbi:MAG: hypothetical protein Kow00127_04160 [Bacteroidales bacterium]